MAWKAFLDPQPWASRFRLFVVDHRPDRRVGVVKPIEMELVDEGMEVEPCLVRDSRQMRELCEAIAEAAWERGWRPQAAQEHKNELTATRAHLEDMRRISFLAVEGKFEEEKE